MGQNRFLFHVLLEVAIECLTLFPEKREERFCLSVDYSSVFLLPPLSGFPWHALGSSCRAPELDSVSPPFL